MQVRTIESGVVLLLAVPAVWDGSRILIFEGGKVGAVGGGVNVLTLGLILAGLAIAHLRQGRSGGSGAAYSWGDAQGLRRVGLAVLMAGGYVPAMVYLGYLLTTALFFVVYLRVFSAYRWLPILVSSSAGAFGATYLWSYLGMTMPQGILPWP